MNMLMCSWVMLLFLPLYAGLSQNMVGIMMHAPNVLEGLRLLLVECSVQGANRAEMLCLG